MLTFFILCVLCQVAFAPPPPPPSPYKILSASRGMANTCTDVDLQGPPLGSSVQYALVNQNSVTISTVGGFVGKPVCLPLKSSDGNVNIVASYQITDTRKSFLVYNSDDVSGPQTNYHLHGDDDSGQVMLDMSAPTLPFGQGAILVGFSTPQIGALPPQKSAKMHKKSFFKIN